MTERSDADLVSAHLAGDRGALAAIYDRYADSLYDTAAAMLGDRHDAEDLAHDVFVVASRSLSQLRDPARLKPWLFAVLRHEVYKRTKRRARSRPTDFTDTGVGDMAATPDTHAEAGDVEREELAAFVRAAAAGLAERDQLLLELSVRQGLTGADLAAAVGVTPDQCHVLVHRMRERVQRSIGALTVARYGRSACPDLQTLLQRWNGVFDPPTRKRIAGHIDDCAVCGETSRKFAVIPLLAAAPALAAPASLRDRVLASTSSAAPTATTTEPPYRFDADGGFPRLARGVGRAVVAIVVAVVAVLLLGGTWLALASGDRDGERSDATTQASAARPDVTEPSGPTVTSIPATTLPVAETTAPATSVATTSTTSTSSSSSTTTSSTSTTTSSTTTTVATTATTTATTTVAPVAPVAPPADDPPVTTPPPPPPPPPPGQLSLSTSTVDLGASAPSAPLTISNTGGQPIDWSINGAPGPFSLSAATGTLAPGAAVDVTVALNRTTLPEGDLARSLTVTTATGGSTGLRLLGAVEHPPVVTVAAATSSLVCPFTTGAPMRVTVSDESAVSSVVLSWTGPGAAGQVNMRLGAAGWSGRVTPEPVNGTWTWTATATDARGNTGSAGAVLVVVGC